MKEQYRTVFNNYRKLYVLALERILKEIGMFETDVIRRSDGKRGRLRVGSANLFSPFGSNIYFFPYRKDEQLSSATCGVIYISDKLKEELQQDYEVVQ